MGRKSGDGRSADPMEQVDGGGKEGEKWIPHSFPPPTFPPLGNWAKHNKLSSVFSAPAIFAIEC